MFLFNWVFDVLGYLGLYHKNARLVFLGLDNAGKTTLLHMLKDEKVAMHEPTQHPHSEVLTMGKIRFQTFDLGGHEIARRIWRDYVADVNGVVFLVDSADRGRFEESKKELDIILNFPELKNVPIVVLGNKIDKRSAASEEELREGLGLLPHTTYGRKTKGTIEGVRPVEVFMCSVVQKMGYAEGFQWLSKFLN